MTSSISSFKSIDSNHNFLCMSWKKKTYNITKTMFVRSLNRIPCMYVTTSSVSVYEIIVHILQCQSRSKKPGNISF